MLLKPFHSDKSFAMDRFCVVDLESGGNINDLYMLGFYDGENYVSYWEQEGLEQFLDDFLTKKYRNWSCFAHNGRKYDFNFIYDSLSRRTKYKLTILPQNGIAEIIVEDGNKNKWYFKDSIRLMHSSLKALTSSFQVEHQKGDINFREMRNLPKSDVVSYNRLDCLGLYEVLQKYFDAFRPFNIPIKSTIAAQSMMAFRTMLEESVPQVKRSTEEFIRCGYYGGRVEIFNMHCEGEVNVYDFNSLYPTVMLNQPMPVGRPTSSKEISEGKIGFFEALVHVPKHEYFPCLPVRIEHKLMFPVGNLRGVFSSLELEYAAQHGCRVEIIRGFEFKAKPIFSKFVEKFYLLKKNSTGAKREVYKYILNSTSGKFGQNRFKEIIYQLPSGSSIAGHRYYDDERGLFIKKTESRAGFILPHISATITAKARLILLEAMKNVRGEVYYCDTDSIATDAFLEESVELGGLKLEHHGSEAIFLQPKLYAIRNDMGKGDMFKAKGFERDFVKGLTFDDYRRGLEGNFSGFKQRLEGLVMFRQSVSQHRGLLETVVKKKTIKTPYDKRIRLGTTAETKPVELSMF